MPLEGVGPRVEALPTVGTLGSLPDGLDVPLAFPFSSKVGVAYAAIPLVTYVVQRGSGFAATWFGAG